MNFKAAKDELYKEVYVMYQRLLKCMETIRKVTDFKPEVALVLGSGLGGYSKKMQVVSEIAYKDIEGFPVSTVEGPDGRFLFGYVADVPVVLMKGRVHYYEGYDITEVVMPIRLMGMLGAKTLILTNAAGGINTDYRPGNLMLITDHISSLMPNPLRGANIAELGVRFPDMSCVYDRNLCDTARMAAKTLGLDLKEGIYLQTPGPSYETPTEIKMYRGWGADAVGMSTVCEAIAARHMGLNICGISCITNMAAGILNQPLNHEEVQKTADRVKTDFEQLVTEIISSVGKQN